MLEIHDPDQHAGQRAATWLAEMEGKTALLVGETISDEYAFCEALGKSGKEPILAVEQVRVEKYQGGIMAIANQMQHLGVKTTVLTGHPIIKRRYLEQHLLQKMFEVYEMLNAHMDRLDAPSLKDAGNYDLVIVADYGHGLLTAEARHALACRPKFLAVNTQLNAGNAGFNLISSRYARADYICLSEKELRLDAGDRDGSLDAIMANKARRLHCRMLMVTQGKQGMRCWVRTPEWAGIVARPALTTTFKDRVGAGDAVFGITAVCAMLGAPAIDLCTIGNAVGALSIQRMGNEPLLRVEIEEVLACK